MAARRLAAAKAPRTDRKPVSRVAMLSAKLRQLIESVPPKEHEDRVRLAEVACGTSSAKEGKAAVRELKDDRYALFLISRRAQNKSVRLEAAAMLEGPQ